MGPRPSRAGTRSMSGEASPSPGSMRRAAWLAVAPLLAIGVGVYIWLQPQRPGEGTRAPEIGQALSRQAMHTVQAPVVRFTDITQQAGIRFRHVNGAFGQKLLPETMGSGVAFLDFDRD